jgi:diamine N-acetyltransferase
MDTDQFTIRKAVQADAETLTNLGRLAFTQAYAALNTPENFAIYLAGAFYYEKQAQELAAPGSTFLIISKDDQPAGYARLLAGSAKDCVTADNPMELVRFYVLEEWKGKGVAYQLMEACLAEASQGGCDVIWLSAWKENLRALAFYRKWGFVETGSAIFTVGNDPQEDAIMARRVGP